MKITRTSMASGETRTLDLDVTEAQFARWREGEHIQDVAPQLSAADREFILTGITAEEWAEVFTDDDAEAAR